MGLPGERVVGIGEANRKWRVMVAVVEHFMGHSGAVGVLVLHSWESGVCSSLPVLSLGRLGMNCGIERKGFCKRDRQERRKTQKEKRP